MVIVHLVARTTRSSAALTDGLAPRLAWDSLRRAFPDALACVLMPDHIHLITPATSVRAARRRLARVLGGLRHRRELRAIAWEPVPPPAIIPDAHHLARQVRYVALNPCRRGLVGDPLEWLWSTHRDLFGAVVHPWVSAERLAAALGRSRHDFERRHLRYVAGDPSVRGDAMNVPTAAAITDVAIESLADVMAAVAAATRTAPASIRSRGPAREIFLGVAPLVGWCSTSILARCTGLSPRSVRRRARASGSTLSAVLLCLGDVRLRAYSRRDAVASLTEQRSDEATRAVA